MRRVLVTGATGFIGRHVAAPLVRRGFEVHAVGRGEVDGCRMHQCDLLDPAAAARLVRMVAPSHLLHLAWYVKPGRYWTAPENLDWVAATLNLYRAFTSSGGKRFVGAGTCAEYDWRYSRLKEGDTPYRPDTLYGIAKDATRRLVETSARLEGTSFGWGHVFFLYGPGEARARLVSDVAVGCLRGETIPTTAGTQIRDFMHVQDIADAFAALLDSEVQGAVNIASGEARPLAALIAAVANAAGRPDLPQFGVRPIAANDPPCLAADVTRLRDEVGFQPTFGLEDGVTATVGWWRGQMADV